MELHGNVAQTRFVIDEESRVGECRRAAQLMARRAGMDEVIVGRVAIVATELANNILRHARSGELLLQSFISAGAPLIELMALDRGPGMQDVERCLADGYSTAGTAGTGLGAVRRLADEFDIHSAPGLGTVVLARLGARMSMRFGAVSTAMEGESECGDSWCLAAGESAIAVIVADGLGHGPFAALAARAAMQAFGAAPFDPPSEVLQRAHRALSGTRGAAVACASMGGSGSMAYAGLGNIAGTLLSAERSQGLVSHNGTLGLQTRHIRQQEYVRPAHSWLVMHSDGISARWDPERRQQWLTQHPATAAGMIYRDYGRNRDDATVVVVG